MFINITGFLLVPEASNVDEQTLDALASAEHDDFYLSNASPLGVLFNNFRKSSAEEQRLERIKKGRPGSPCIKKFLCNNTEFGEDPICTASREYQHLKLKELDSRALNKEAYTQKYDEITAKTCLCEGLCTSAYLKNGMLKPRESKAVAICPGPNLAYFSRKYSLKEMVDHIYGRIDLLTNVSRPNLFINELQLYLDYLKQDMMNQLDELQTRKRKYYENFRSQLMDGIQYYKRLIPEMSRHAGLAVKDMQQQLINAENMLQQIQQVLLA